METHTLDLEILGKRENSSQIRFPVKSEASGTHRSALCAVHTVRLRFAARWTDLIFFGAWVRLGHVFPS